METILPIKKIWIAVAITCLFFLPGCGSNRDIDAPGKEVIPNPEEPDVPHTTQYRGAMIWPSTFGSNAQLLGEVWNANLVRWQFISGWPDSPLDSANFEEYFEWLNDELDQLDAMLPTLKQYGLNVCLDIHTPPGGRDNGVMRIFRDIHWQNAFVEIWEYLATRYKDEEMIWGYDLVNEPNEGDRQDIPGNCLDWRGLGLRTAKAIRKIDPETRIIFESYRYADPVGFENFTVFDPKEVPNMVYSAHMYNPHIFTHQSEDPDSDSYHYPGTVPSGQWDTDQTYFDKEALRRELSAIIRLQQEQGAKIFIGEFGCVRFAPDNSAYRYYRDLIELFEEYGWDWTYHSFREWHAFDVEIDPSILWWTDVRGPEPTDTELMIREYFAKNKK